MSIVNPFIKKKENQEWLEKNEETFIQYMGLHHSVFDMAHTYLHLDTFNDAYIESMIKSIEVNEKKKIRQEKLLKAKISTKGTPKKTAIEQKIETMETAADEKLSKETEDVLFD
jgi:hypothetical protein